MKIKANSSSSLQSETVMPSRRTSLRLSIGASILLLSGIAMADGATRRDLRRFGFAGAYTGVVRGKEFLRTNASSAFTDLPVSKLTVERLPQLTRQKVASPFGNGTTYFLFVKTTVNQRRAVLRGLYFGEGFNPALAATTVRTGAKVLEVKRIGGSGKIGSMTLTDEMMEYNTSGDLLARWKYNGSLEK